jgi:2-iminobutanoate/2-iminopropanoate deaminase
LGARTVISTYEAAAPAAHYSQAIRTENLVFTAGCVGVDPATGDLGQGFEEQTRQTLRNVQLILEASGSSVHEVVKTTCFLKRIEDFGELDRVYREFFSGDPPARTTIRADLVREEFLVEVEAVATISPSEP